MYFKKMVGKKCYLSPININDAEKIAEWLNDLEISVNLFQLYYSSITVENEKMFLEKLSKEHNYSIIDKETNELMGNCGLKDVDHINQTAEFGMFIGNKNYWNKGYGRDALTLLIDWGFKALNLYNIYVRICNFNNSSQRMFEKVGFKKIGARRKALQRNLERHDIVYMDILAHEFYEKNSQFK